MVGKDDPFSIVRMYPAFCPMERLISLADTPFFVRSSASRLENCSSYIGNHPPSLLYCSREDGQNRRIQYIIYNALDKLPYKTDFQQIFKRHNGVMD